MPAKKNAARSSVPHANAGSDSSEDHLERIHELIEEKGYARTSDIAERLGIARSSVSNMVQRLAARGLVNYERYRGLTLTKKGLAVAQSIKVRHKILTGFLVALGLNETLVAEEVEDIEHHLNPHTIAALHALTQYWIAHPEEHDRVRKHLVRHI
ncbi:MAG: transcriptional regulator MntR [Opitutaceae bacterium]